MLTLLWSEKALEELDDLTAYIGERNQLAADNLLERIEFCAERLTAFPYMHRSGRVPGTREAVVNPNYVLVYRVTADTLKSSTSSTPASNTPERAHPAVHPPSML